MFSDSVKPYLSTRLRVKVITSRYPFWLQFKYRQDEFYKYALSPVNKDQPIDAKSSFHFVCHHRETHAFVGYANGYIANNVHSIWIQSFFIDKSYLRQGYGREFFNEIITILTTQVRNYLDKIYLTCYEQNTIGVQFWEKLSFVKIRETIKQIPSHDLIGIYERSVT